jgi:hypothetical protein
MSTAVRPSDASTPSLRSIPASRNMSVDASSARTSIFRLPNSSYNNVPDPFNWIGGFPGG